MGSYTKYVEAQKLTKENMDKLLALRNSNSINKSQAYKFFRMLNKMNEQLGLKPEPNTRCFCNSKEIEEVVSKFFNLYDSNTIVYDDKNDQSK